MKKKIVDFFKKTNLRSVLTVVGIVLVIITALLLLWQGKANSNQAMPAMTAKVYFDGEYRIDDGDWQKIVKGEHISSTKGDVTLRGNFHMLAPDGEYAGIYRGDIPIAFYVDHINLTFFEVGSDPFVVDMENGAYGDSACGINWEAYFLTSNSEDEVEILIHNPHSFGNEYAIDDMLSKIALWTPIEFEKGVLDSGASQRNVGIAFVIASVMFLGTALFSSLIHVKNTKFIWLLGLVIFFAGIYFTYSSFGISFWSESIVFNTSALGISMMFYSFFLSVLITASFQKMKKVGVIINIILGVVNVVLLVLPMITKVYFYDTWHVWVIIQNALNLALIVCIISELTYASRKNKWVHLVALLPLITLLLDSVATFVGLWEGGIASKYTFIILFIVAIVVLLRIIPRSINAIAKTKELETEKLVLKTQLTESRVSTMMSQIRQVS